MKIKNKELQPMIDGLKSIKGLADWKTKMTVVRNIKVIEKELSVREETFSPTDEMKEWEKARAAVAEKYAKKDEKGKPVYTPDKVSGRAFLSLTPQDETKVNMEVKELSESKKWKPVTDSINKANADFLEMLECEANIEVFEIQEKHLKRAQISEEALMSIYSIIEFEEEEKITELKVVKKPTQKKRVTKAIKK